MMSPTALNPDEFWRTWTTFVRGDVHRLRAPRDTRGQEQQGARFAVIVQSDDLMLSTLLVAPTSRSAAPRSFRPTILVNDEETQVLVEQTSAVAPERLGDLIGRVTHDELREINDALRLALELD
jgi:mRNA interferase MazF